MVRTVGGDWESRACWRSVMLWSIVGWVGSFGHGPAVVQADDPKAAAPSAWLHIYARDRRQINALETAQKLVQQSQFAEAVPQLRFILSQPRDAWMSLPSGEVVSVHRQTLRLLEVERTPLLGIYQQAVTPDAQSELARAREADAVSGYLGVVRRYFPTPEAFIAAEWLIKQWLDDGDWQRAAALSVRVMESPVHRRQMHPRFLRMAVLACDLAGRATESDAVRERLTQLTSLQPRANDDAGKLPMATAAATSLAAPSPPVLEPDWSQPLESAGAYPQLERILAEWAAVQREQDEPTAIGWAPVRAGQRLVFRDLDTIRALDIATGATVWRYRTTSGLGELLNPSNRDGVRQRYRGAMWDAAAANSLVSGLSTDGQRVYALDATEEMLLAGIYGLDSGQLPQMSRRKAARNRLVALDVWGEGNGSRLIWASDKSPDQALLVNHAFLGPPLISAGVLYVISENDRELCVTALQAASGRVLWQQPIAEAERSVVEEKGRITRACVPVQSQDLIVCPTHIGLLVAVDAVTGELRWVHESLDQPPDARAPSFRNLPTLTQRHHASFPCTPISTDGAIVYLPSQSDKLFCLDAATGKARWSVKADQVDYLATVSDNRVVVLGKFGAQAFNLANGQSLWTSPLSSVVSGLGVDIPGGYLVPLESGQVINLDLESGQSRGFRFGESPQPLGHLLATSEMVLSVGSHGVAAYPQSHTVLSRLSKATAPGQAAASALKVAEVRLAEGNLQAAIEALETSWRLVAEGPQRQRTRRLLWEAYFQLLREDPDQTDHCLSQLERLTQKSSPQELARWLIAATARAEVRRDERLLLTQFLQLAAASDDNGLFESPTDRHLEVSSVTWLRLLYQRLNDAPLRGELRQRLLSLAEGGGTDPGAQAAERIATDSDLGAIRLRQAATYVQTNQRQRAAVLFSRTESSESPPMIAAGEKGLAQLFTDSELCASAGRTVLQIQQASGVAAADFDPSEFLGNSPAAEAAIEAWRRARPVDWPVEKVIIRSRPREHFNVGESRASRDRAPQFDPLEDYQRQILPSADAPIEWMLRNGQRGTDVGVFDKLSSKKLFEVVLPFGASPPLSVGQVFAGTLVPFSFPGEVRAISLLDGQNDHVAWSLKLPEWSNRSGQALCGPSTSKCLMLQWKNMLFAVDPLDGRVLWRRNDLEPTSGLYADTRIGLLADDEVVFVLGGDKTAYRVLETSTGEVLRRSVLQQDARFNRASLGRMILHINDENDKRRIRIWDPKTDELLLDDPLRSRQLYAPFSDDAVVWMTDDGRLRVYSVAARATVVDVATSIEDFAAAGTAAASIRALRHNGSYYLSVGRNQPGVSTSHVHMPLQDKLIAETNMRDDVFAISTDGRSIRWQKSISQRSFLQFGDIPVPFLVTAALIRDKRDQNRRWLRVEALDTQTGALLGMADELPNNRLLHVDYDGAAGHLRLLGRSIEIDLDFSPAAQRRWPAAPGPL